MKKLLATISLLTLFLVLVPLPIQAQNCVAGGAPSTNICNALPGLSPAGGPQQWLGRIFIYVGTIVGLLAVVMVVYSGFRMLISQGDSNALQTAKSGFAYAIIGFVVSVLSFVIVIAVQNFIGVNRSNIVLGQLNNPLASADARNLILDITRRFMLFVGVLASVMIMVNVYRYVISSGNEEGLKKAKSGILWSVVGFALVILAYVIVTAVKNLVS
jgi:hypothetical protein